MRVRPPVSPVERVKMADQNVFQVVMVLFALLIFSLAFIQLSSAVFYIYPEIDDDLLITAQSIGERGNSACTFPFFCGEITLRKVDLKKLFLIFCKNVGPKSIHFLL